MDSAMLSYAMKRETVVFRPWRISIGLCKLIQYRNGRCKAPPIPVLNQLAQGSIQQRGIFRYVQ